MIEPIFTKNEDFLKVPNFGQAFRELYWIILAYWNPPGSSYELFWHRKSTISNFRGLGLLVGQQLGQNSCQIWNLRTLNYRDQLWTCPPAICFESKNRETKVPATHFSSTSRNSWNECLRIFFLRYFGRRIRFWYSRNHISSLSYRFHEIWRFRHHVPSFDGEMLLEIFTDRNPPLRARRYDKFLC